MDAKNYYAVLQVPRHASSDEIKAAYRKLAKQYHPDVRPNDKVAEETFKAVSEAYNVLSDPLEKRAYDLVYAYGGVEGGGDGFGPGAYRGNPRGRASSERDSEWAASNFDSDAAAYAELRMRRAREARAAKAQYVRTRPDTGQQPEDMFDFEEWNRMHFGPTGTERQASASQGSKEARAGGAGFKAAGAPGDAQRLGQQATASAGLSETQHYRQFAQQYRAARRSQERMWPATFVALGALLFGIYKFTQKIQER